MLSIQKILGHDAGARRGSALISRNL
jgi:hypothetical protein